MPSRNAKGQFVKGGRKRSGKSRGSAPARRPPNKHSYRVEDVAAAALVGAGALAVKLGGDTPVRAAVSGRTSDMVSQLGQRTPVLGGLSDQPNDAAYLVAAGVGVKALGWAARKLGHRSKHHVKLGKFRLGL